MTIDRDAISGAQAVLAMTPPKPESAAAPNGDFGDKLAAQIAADNQAIQARREANSNADDMAFIRENGFRSYAKKLHEEKMQELREKILEEMGLTEEMLQAMSPDQRQAIEDVIQREIEARVAANSIMNGGDDPKKGVPTENQSVAAIAGGFQGGGASLGMMAVLELQEAQQELTPDAEQKPDFKTKGSF